MCSAFGIVGCHVLIKMFLTTTLESTKQSGWSIGMIPRMAFRSYQRAKFGPKWTSCGYIVPAQMLAGGFQMFF